MRESYIRNTKCIIREDGTVFNSLGNKCSTWVENNSGYTLVRPDRRGTCYRLHRILAEAFIPNPDNLPYVRHLNDVKSDNRLCNLSWGSSSTNAKEGYLNNCYIKPQRCHRLIATCLLTGLEKEFDSIRQCAEVLGLNRKNIAAVLKGTKNNTYNYDFKYL